MIQKSPKILIIDDHLLFAEGLKTLLTSLTTERIVIVTDGNLCLRKLESNSNYDLIILDLMMPNVDGI
jgi:two-component system response regulator CpxR